MLKERNKFGVSDVDNFEDKFFNECIRPKRSFAVSDVLFLLTDPRLADDGAGEGCEVELVDRGTFVWPYSREYIQLQCLSKM